jgi:hypothetical protein
VEAAGVALPSSVKNRQDLPRTTVLDSARIASLRSLLREHLNFGTISAVPGRYRVKRNRATDVAFTIRMPGALKADLQDAAEAHGCSLNEEMLRRMMGPQTPYRSGLTREQWNAMMELEPGPDDERTNSEIAQQMETIHPSRYVSGLGHTDRLTDREVAEGIAEIELLPGSLPF